MSQGPPSSGDGQVISVKVLVDTSRDRVIFAECDCELIDTLLAFLTLPLGTVVRLLIPDSTPIGSITSIYKSVSSLEVRHLRTDFCKAMLLNPRNASETQSSKLKLNVYPLEPAKLYKCPDWFSGPQGTGRCRFSTFVGGLCGCGSQLQSRVDIEVGEAITEDGEEGGGVFVKDGAARFMITDDLQVIPGSTAACISLLRKLGIDDGNEVAERTIEIGAKQVALKLE